MTKNIQPPRKIQFQIIPYPHMALKQYVNSYIHTSANENTNNDHDPLVCLPFVTVII